MNLQYKLSNGSWVDCDKRTDEFILMCIKFNGVDEGGKITTRSRAIRELTKEEAIVAIESGEELRNHDEDWYSVCRCGDAAKAKHQAKMAAQKPVEMFDCSCGHTVPKPMAMWASIGSSCPDCYDRLS